LKRLRRGAANLSNYFSSRLSFVKARRANQNELLALQEKIRALTLQLQAAAEPEQPRGLGALTRRITSLGGCKTSPSIKIIKA
jgi:hypothetical protein